MLHGRIRKQTVATPQDTAAKVVELINEVERVLTAEELSPAEKQCILSTVIEAVTPVDDGVKIQLRIITLEMILVIDNYDSFTYNLVQYLGELGAELEIVRNDKITLAEIAAMAPEKIVISPGPCTPSEAGVSVDVVREFGPRIPILGVCLGHQAIGAAYGADIVRAPILMHGKTSAIHHHGEGVFAGLPSPLEATRYHSLIIKRETLPDTLKITAEADDGTIQGVLHRDYPVEGVQFHPESVLTSTGMQMLKTFLSR